MKKTNILKSYKEGKVLRLKQPRHWESVLQAKTDGITNMFRVLEWLFNNSRRVWNGVKKPSLKAEEQGNNIGSSKP